MFLISRQAIGDGRDRVERVFVMSHAIQTEALSRWIRPARCGICGKRVGASSALPYTGLVCWDCDGRALDRNGQQAQYSSANKIGETSSLANDFDGPNPVFIDGIRCWRRYRLGGHVTMRDLVEADSEREWYERAGVFQRSDEYKRLDAILAIELSGGLSIEEPLARLLEFCREEYAYYDGIPDTQPNHITAIDVLATVSVNAFSSSGAKVIREVHRGLAAACDAILAQIPHHARLENEGFAMEQMATLLAAGVSVPQVLIPRVTKVLHRKRPALIPMIDNELIKHYGTVLEIPNLLDKMQNKMQAAQLALQVVETFRDDLLATHDKLEVLQYELAVEGFSLSLVRILEVLLWISVEPSGYYPVWKPEHQPEVIQIVPAES